MDCLVNFAEKPRRVREIRENDVRTGSFQRLFGVVSCGDTESPRLDRLAASNVVRRIANDHHASFVE